MKKKSLTQGKRPKAKAENRPAHFSMPIQGGMLDALGINMYTTIGKCLVEFIANAYDGEASKVEISIPFDAIDEGRKAVRAAAREAVKSNKRDPYEALLDPLPDALAVEITDDGHGMSWEDVRSKFLPLNRRRRAAVGQQKETLFKSENGKRFVMGRKGLGKLAGFGAAETVQVKTKRSGQTFSTIITLEDKILKSSENVSKVRIPAKYLSGLEATSHGTTVRLSRLKADAVKGGPTGLQDAILESFSSLRPEEFAIYLNGELLKHEMPNYEYMWPEGLALGDYATTKITLDDVPDIEFRYYVGFRRRNDHLPARKRGARIYCNNRLAAGPSLFSLGTGMHSFHSVDYMECVVEADALDRSAIDFVNTNRTQLKEDNEIVRALMARVTEIMSDAIRGHGRFREKQAEEEVEINPDARRVRDIVNTLPKKTRAPAQRLLHTLAAEWGVQSTEFREMAPILVNSVNATDVLVRLIGLQTKPETLEKVAFHLRELGEIEKIDALKLYRGKRSGIAALQHLMETGIAEWGKHRLEKQLQNLLKENPWLIRPEFSRFLTSDKDLQKVVSSIAKHLEVDDFVPITDESGNVDETRPDLVFVMSDPSSTGPHIVHVVELKSPTLGLNLDHFRQLEDYVAKVESWCKAEARGPVAVRGYLIGAMPDSSTSSFKQRQLLDRFSKEGANAQIRIIGLQQLILEARQAHLEAIEILEEDLGEEELYDERPKALTHKPTQTLEYKPATVPQNKDVSS